MQDFRKLQVWERSHRLVLELYRLTAGYPAEERFGIVSQLRRAAVSIPTNIAEGSKRRQPRDFAHFLNIAESSLAETEYLLILSKDLGYLQDQTVSAAILLEVSEIGKMLNRLHCKVLEGQG